jgi:hypothetical protein
MVATIFVRRIPRTVPGAADARPAVLVAGAVDHLLPSTIGGMLRPTRPVPHVGASVRIGHFGGGWERGTVAGVGDQGRRLTVVSEAGEALDYVLSPATAKFVPAGSPYGGRLELLEGMTQVG